LKLETSRLLLIPCSLDAAKSISLNESLPDIIGFDISCGWPTKDTRDVAPVYYVQLLGDPTVYGWGLWFIIEKQERKVIGDAGFKGKPNQVGEVEIGYGIVPEYQNQGYATEAAQALIDFAFKEGKVKKVKAICEINNKPSIKVLEKLHFRRMKTDEKLILWEIKNVQFVSQGGNK
jgi:[ribosomal protein S5]-alanine N-acetyltransferase